MSSEENSCHCPVSTDPLPLPGDVSTQTLVILLQIFIIGFTDFLFIKQFVKIFVDYLTDFFSLLSALPREVPLVLLLHGWVVHLERDVGVPQSVETIFFIVNIS